MIRPGQSPRWYCFIHDLRAGLPFYALLRSIGGASIFTAIAVTRFESELRSFITLAGDIEHDHRVLHDATGLPHIAELNIYISREEA